MAATQSGYRSHEVCAPILFSSAIYHEAGALLLSFYGCVGRCARYSQRHSQLLQFCEAREQVLGGCVFEHQRIAISQIPAMLKEAQGGIRISGQSVVARWRLWPAWCIVGSFAGCEPCHTGLSYHHGSENVFDVLYLCLQRELLAARRGSPASTLSNNKKNSRSQPYLRLDVALLH